MKVKTIEELRNKFFMDCTNMNDGNPKVDIAPHNLFEWIKENMIVSEPKDDLIRQITGRIKDEHSKHSQSLPDEWFEICARKIVATLPKSEPKQVTEGMIEEITIFPEKEYHFQFRDLETLKGISDYKVSGKRLMQYLHNAELSVQNNEKNMKENIISLREEYLAKKNLSEIKNAEDYAIWLEKKILEPAESEQVTEGIEGSVLIHRLNDYAFEELLKYLNVNYEIVKKEPFCDTEFKISIQDLDSAIWIGRRFQMNLQGEELKSLQNKEQVTEEMIKIIKDAWYNGLGSHHNAKTQKEYDIDFECFFDIIKDYLNLFTKSN